MPYRAFRLALLVGRQAKYRLDCLVRLQGGHSAPLVALLVGLRVVSYRGLRKPAFSDEEGTVIGRPISEKGVYIIAIICVMGVFLGGHVLAFLRGEPIRWLMVLVDVTVSIAAGIGAGRMVVIGLRGLSRDRGKEG